MRVERVEPGGPAASAGLTAGDRIVAVNGRPLETIYRYWDAVDRGRPGETVGLTVQRQVDSRREDVALELGAFHLPAGLESIKLTVTQLLALNLLSLYPIPFLVVAAIVLTQPAGSGLPSLDAVPLDRDASTRMGATLVKAGELPSSISPLTALRPELIAPMQGLEQRVEGLLVLGPRLSEEPYGREDRDLISSVASHAGAALQNFRLARAMAERMEAERLADRELEIAREVQAKLLPQRAPVLESLDYAGTRIQARQVGGDYYDFLDLGPGRLGLVPADISGKGISAALLMASLQASLRSQYAEAPDDIPGVLRAVNRTFYDSTPTSRYATLFFGVYDEQRSQLRYANCGHPPPVLLSCDGSVERLQPTGPVLGLFEELNCTTADVVLASQDTLVMFTDGVVESFTAREEEFGESRLLDVVRQRNGRSAAELLDAVVEAVQRHSGPAQSDDLTLVIARVRA